MTRYKRAEMRTVTHERAEMRTVTHEKAEFQLPASSAACKMHTHPMLKQHHTE